MTKRKRNQKQKSQINEPTLRIGIFGGTFNPPHRGHRHIAEDFREQMAESGLPLDKILVIPTFVPPHKAAPELATGEDRLAMCRLCFEEGIFEVSNLEIERADTSYTYQTLEILREEYPTAEFYFLMGDDMLLYLPKWVYPEKILENAILVSTVRSKACTIGELRAFAKENYRAQYKAGRFLFFESEPFPVSSTKVRDLWNTVATGTEEAPAARAELQRVLDPAVLRYILERGLYQ